MSGSTESFQVSAAQAEIYEEKFVPAIFAQWTVPLLRAAGVGRGQVVLDVACGTGALAREAADRVGRDGRVAGVDINEGMLAVARRLRPDLEWRVGDAVDLPWSDAAFDVVLCQSALMFFPDATGALREMGRVCRPGGTVGVQVYRGLDDQPAYGPFTEIVARHAGAEAAALLGTYWVHGDADVVRDRFTDAGLEVTGVTTHAGVARWASVDEMVAIEIGATPLVDRMGADVYARIRSEANAVLGEYQAGDGAEVPIDALVVTARRP